METTLDLRQLETFLAVVETGSFHKAGQRLGCSQPTISQHIRKLELVLGTTLIERHPSGCAPTGAAEILIPYAQSLLRISRRAVSAFTRQSLVVGASGNIGTYMLPHVASVFERRADSVPVEFVLTPNPSAAAKLESGELDVALLEWWDDRPGFAATAWRDEKLVVIVPPAHPWARRSGIAPAALEDAVLLGGEPGSGTGRLLRQALGSAGIPNSRVRQLGSTEAVKRAVRAGLGISIVMESSVTDEVRAGTLCTVLLEGVTLKKTLYAAHRAHVPAGSPIRLFIEALREFGATAPA
jgi:DNA-binding transcriptional LysR family regulator